MGGVMKIEPYSVHCPVRPRPLIVRVSQGSDLTLIAKRIVVTPPAWVVCLQFGGYSDDPREAWQIGAIASAFAYLLTVGGLPFWGRLRTVGEPVDPYDSLSRCVWFWSFADASQIKRVALPNSATGATGLQCPPVSREMVAQALPQLETFFSKSLRVNADRLEVS